MLNLKVCIVALLTVNSLAGFSQNVKYLQGRIINIETELPVSYANITCGNTGVITNLNGNFKLELPANILLANDTIVISSIGYDVVKILSDTINSKTYTINLEPSVIQLSEVVIHGSSNSKLTPNEIVSRAIEKLKYNVCSNSVYLESFYKQKHYFVNTESGRLTYLRYIEAALLLESAARQPYDYKINEVRRSNDYRSLERFTEVTNEKARVKDLEFNLKKDFLNLDRTKLLSNEATLPFSLFNSEIGNLNKEFVKKHKFKLDTITFYNNKWVYVIKILPSKNSIYLTANDGGKKKYFFPIGKIFISGDDFSILEMQYSYILNPKMTNSSTAEFLKFSYQGEVLFRDIIRYKEYRGKYYLSYLMRERGSELFIGGSKASGLMRKKKQSGAIEEDKGYFRIKQELIVTKIIKKNVITDNSFLNAGYNSLFPQTYFYNKDFWTHYNKLLLDIEEEGLLIDLGKGMTIEQQFFMNGKSSNE